MASCWKLPSEYTKSCKQFTFHGSGVYGEASNTNDSPRGSRRNKILNPLQTEKHGMAKVGRMGYRLEMRHLECVRRTGPFPNNYLHSLVEVCQHCLCYSRDDFFSFAYTIHSVSMPCVTSCPQLCLSFATATTRLPP